MSKKNPELPIEVNPELLHAEWVSRLLAHPRFKIELIFEPVRGSDPIKPISSRLGHVKKFERKFSRLCREFELDVENPSYDNGFLEKTGKLGYNLAALLIKVMQETQEYRAQLENDLLRTESKNKKRRRGPTKVPVVLAEHILCALHLHKNSPEGLLLLRRFLGPNGGLEVEARKYPSGLKRMSRLIYERSEKEIGRWAANARQTFERVILSAELGKEVKVFAEHEPNLKRLRVRVSRLAERILQDIKSRID